MTPTTKQVGRTAESAELRQSGPRPYILTLCRLESPTSIRPPQSPHLKPFTFFTSRSRHADGSERLHLHMGYFGTQKQAQKWAQLMRARYPQVIVTPAPAALLRQRDSRVPTVSPATDSASLTDTQVMQVLTMRRAGPARSEPGVEAKEDVSVLRPDDTKTRRILKEAVVRGAPVSFAVQLVWSDQPIELASLPGLSIFRAYKLYKTEATRQGRLWYGLRLGFFDDAISAKQVAYYVRSRFASVAVVPISDAERAGGTERPIDPSLLADPTLQRIEEALETDRPRPIQGSAGAVPQPARPRTPAAGQSADARLEQTHDMLPASEIWGSAGR